MTPSTRQRAGKLSTIGSAFVMETPGAWKAVISAQASAIARTIVITLAILLQKEMIPIQKVFFALRSAFFVPHAVLLSAAGINPSSIAQTFTWDLAPTVSTVTLPPGGTYRLEVPLSAVLTLPPKPQLLSLGVST